MATPCEIVFIDECNFVNYGRRFFIDEGDEAEDEEEYDISQTDSSDFSSDFSEQEDTSSSEEESPIPTSVSGRRRKKSTKKQATKKPNGKQSADKKGKVGGKKNKFLTKTELDELTDKLKDKRPVCWSFVSEKLGKQPVINHSEAHRYVIEYILDKRYSELRHFVDHMYSSYILSRLCNDWPRGSLNESIVTAIGKDFCHGLRMSFWDFGFHTTAHKNNQVHLALFDCLLIPNRPIFRHRCVITRQCRPCIYYANSVSTFQPLLVGDLVFKINPGLMYNAGLRIRFVWPIYRPSSHKGLNLRVASVFSRSLASYMFSHAGFIGS